MLNIFSSSHGEEQALLGAGLVEIMRDFLIVMVLIALFLVTLVLSFYRQRRAESTGLLETLGIRSDARFAAWIREIVLCFAAAGIAGMAAGTLLIQLFRSVAGYFAPELGDLGNVTVFSYLWTAGGVFLIELVGFAISHDMEAARSSTDGRAAAARRRLRGHLRRDAPDRRRARLALLRARAPRGACRRRRRSRRPRSPLRAPGASARCGWPPRRGPTR